jgi:hypothetical protein
MWPIPEVFKENFQNFSGVLEKLKGINVFTYNFKPELQEEFGLSSRLTIGVLAQEVEKIFPQLVRASVLVSKINGSSSQPNTQKTMDAKTVNYEGFIPVLLEAIKEQQQQIEAQQKQIDELTKKVNGNK